MSTKTLTTLALITATFGCADADKTSETSDDRTDSADSTLEEDADNGMPVHSDEATDLSASDDLAHTYVDGLVLRKNGDERALVSGIAYQEGHGSQSSLIVLLTTWDLGGCDAFAPGDDIAWYDNHTTTDWNAIEVDITDQRYPRLKAWGAISGMDPDYFQGAGAEGAGAEIDLDAGTMPAPGQMISGVIWADETPDMDIIDAVDADFDVEFCGPLQGGY